MTLSVNISMGVPVLARLFFPLPLLLLRNAMAEIEVTICSCPGCDQPGPSLCASCKLVGYCCRTCQVEDWSRHKEECQGHMRKVGMAHLQKARSFDQDRNWLQSLRYSELALVKLKQLNDRPIDAIDNALRYKFNALNYMGQDRESLECAKERYCLYLTSHSHPPAIRAAFGLIQSCIHNNEYEDAELYARTTWETITLSRDSHIPDDERQYFTARGAYYLAYAMFELALNGGIPPEANQTVGQEAISLVRRALEIHTQLHGLEHSNVANVIGLLADALDYFNDNGDDVEVLRLYEQSITITARVEGSLSVNVATGKNNLANVYRNRAKRARAANDLDGEMASLEQALPRFREAARIYRINNHVDLVDKAERYAVAVEEQLRELTTARGGAAAAAAASTARG